MFICRSRLDRAGLSGGGVATGGARRSSGNARGLEVRLELFRGTGGTGGMSSLPIDRSLRGEASDSLRLGSSMPPPRKSIAGKAGGLAGALGTGLAYDSPAVENDAASSSAGRELPSAPARSGSS